MYSRTRTRGGLTPSAKVSFWYIYDGCTPTAWTKIGDYDGPLLGKIETMSDVVVPNFRERLAKGEVFFNPMSKQSREVSSTGGQGLHVRSKTMSCPSLSKYHEMRKDGDWFGRTVLGGTLNVAGPLPLLNEDDLESARVEVSTSVLNKVGRSDSNLWESLAEIHKTGRMFRNLGQRAVKAATQVRAASGEYLGYRYGIRPLLNDYEEIVKGLQKEIGKVRRNLRSGMKLGAEEYVSGTVNQNYVANHYTLQRVDEVILRAMVMEEFTASLANNIGFSAKGLLTLPWELVRLSFVVDWFINIGDTIGAVAPAFGYDVLGSCLVEERTLRATWLATGTTEDSGTYEVIRPWSGSVTDKRVTKTRSMLRPPGLVVRRNFKFDDFTRAADAFALAAQILGGKRTQNR